MNRYLSFISIMLFTASIAHAHHNANMPIELHDGEKQCWIHSETKLRSSDHLIVGFVKTIELMHTTSIQLKEFRAQNSNAFPLVYSYVIEANDGRIWAQTLIFKDSFSDTNPGMTFAITEPWKFSEFVKHREVRDVVIAIINAIQATDIRCKR